MAIELHSDRHRPVSEHLSELHGIVRTSTVLMLIAMLAWSYGTDSLMRLWLDSLPLGAASMNISQYSPVDWLEIRSSMAILLSILTVMPFLSLRLQRFARPGLLPSERSWLTLIMALSTVLVPVIVILCWAYLLPLLVGTAQAADTLGEVGSRYDAGALFRLSLGLSWVLVCTMLATVTLSMARLLGLVERGEIRFRARLLLVFGGLLVMTMPSEYEGLRLLIAVTAMLSADRLSATLPNATLGRRSFVVRDIATADNLVYRLALLDCGCEGACPRFPDDVVPDGVASPACSALCLNPSEQASVAELVLHHGITRLVIGGCDSSPIPAKLRSTLDSLGCESSGLGWLDDPRSSDESWREESICYSTSQTTGSALD